MRIKIPYYRLILVGYAKIKWCLRLHIIKKNWNGLLSIRLFRHGSSKNISWFWKNEIRLLIIVFVYIIYFAYFIKKLKLDYQILSFISDIKRRKLMFWNVLSKEWLRQSQAALGSIFDSLLCFRFGFVDCSLSRCSWALWNSFFCFRSRIFHIVRSMVMRESSCQR